MNRLTPLVKWAGGKTTLLRDIAARTPDVYGTYHEPFVGGGAAFLALRPTRAVLADTNAELIAMYAAVRDEPEPLMRALDRHQTRVADRDHYYEVRARDPAALPPVEAAARFIYLNKTCYNGLYRVNRAGTFNVPLGRFKTPPTLYNRDNLLAVSAALAHAELRCADYRAALADASPGDFAYLDPPYHPASATASFTAYTPLGFGETQQRELAAEVARLTERGVAVLLSNSDTPLIRELHARYAMTEVTVGRAINSKADKRKGARELLVDNYSLMPKNKRNQPSRSSKATAFPVESK